VSLPAGQYALTILAPYCTPFTLDTVDVRPLNATRARAKLICGARGRD
jgi:hypothetical protein